MHMLIKINCTDLFIASKIVGKKTLPPIKH